MILQPVGIVGSQEDAGPLAVLLNVLLPRNQHDVAGDYDPPYLDIAQDCVPVIPDLPGMELVLSPVLRCPEVFVQNTISARGRCRRGPGLPGESPVSILCQLLGILSFRQLWNSGFPPGALDGEQMGSQQEILRQVASCCEVRVEILERRQPGTHHVVITADQMHEHRVVERGQIQDLF